MANNELEGQGDGDGSSTDDTLLSSIDFGDFLTGSSSLEGVNFRAATGIDVVRVAQAAIGAVAFAWLWGVNALIDAVTSSFAALIDGVGSFIGEGLIQSTVGVGIAAVEGIWSFTFSEFGLLAYPIALLSVLATFYVADRGIAAAREVLL